MTSVDITWVRGDQFVASDVAGHSVVLDTPGGREIWGGLKPTDLLLSALGGCTGMDVIGILRKGRQQVSGLRIIVHGDQRESYPRAFDRITIEYEIRGRGISAQAVSRAIELSHEKYCSVAATLSDTVAITTSYTIVEDEANTADGS